ncbi:kinetoplast-associated protein-like protein [Leishmania tarentolae]|uniref:Kinetoplast-associated protein-like protein n=1 Tax=Leishmania tarentolae TaxID=5689 RepID=A0A640KLY8_LEITA|nr:kinetoplast-associated protein-like protein [Leishmania tarentolae]
MAALSFEREKLKQRLIEEYEEQINEQLDARAAAAGDDSVPTPSSQRSYLYQRLLCLRAGRTHGVNVPANASEMVELLAENQPPPEVMIMQRLRKAQDESIRLLAIRAAATAATATARNSAMQDAAVVASGVDVDTAVGAREEAAIKPFTAEERMKLLFTIVEGSTPLPVAESAASKRAPAASTPSDNVAACDECAAEACEDQSEAGNTEEEREVAEEMEEAPAGLAS